MIAMKTYLVLFNVLSALTAVIWNFLVFTVYPYDRYAAFVLTVTLILDFLYLLFLFSKNFGKAALIFTSIWAITALLASNIILINKHSIWTGFEYDRSMGWYPLKSMKNMPLQSLDGMYFVTTDKFGHRNQLPYLPDLEYIVQGDSNLFGFGLKDEETLCRKLGMITGKKFYNFGVSGFDFCSYYFQYKHFAEKFNIKKRIIFFNIENDFTFSMFSSPYLIKRPYLENDNGIIKEFPDNTNALKRQIYGYRFTEKYRQFNPVVEPLAFGRAWGNICPKWVEMFPVFFFFAEKIYPRVFNIISYFYPAEKIEEAAFLNPVFPAWLLLKRELWPQPYKDYANDFERIVSHLKKQNENIYICLFPMRAQVISSDFNGTVNFLLNRGYKKGDINRFSFNEYMADICLKNKIVLVDCTPDFYREGAAEKLFQSGNHLSGKGIELCAKVLAKELR